MIPTAAAPVTRMAAEIREQPAALRRTLDALLPLEPAVAELAARTRQVLFIARGSSDAAALYGRYLCEVGAGRLATPASPSVATRYRRRLDLDGVLAVALSQSGRTEEIVETLTWAADCGATTVAITNDADGPLAAAARLALVTQAGPERAVPATKSTPPSSLRWWCSRSDSAPIRPCAAAGRSARRGRPRDSSPMWTRSPRTVRCDGLVVSGRGFAASTAWDCPSRFGRPARSTQVDCPMRTFCTARSPWPAPALPRCSSPRTTARCSPACWPSPSGCGRRASRCTPSAAAPTLAAAADVALAGPDLPEQLAPLALVVPGQLAVEALARRLGLDPDDPAGLTKVTQTDEEPA